MSGPVSGVRAALSGCPCASEAGRQPEARSGLWGVGQRVPAQGGQPSLLRENPQDRKETAYKLDQHKNVQGWPLDTGIPTLPQAQPSSRGRNRRKEWIRF